VLGLDGVLGVEGVVGVDGVLGVDPPELPEEELGLELVGLALAVELVEPVLVEADFAFTSGSGVNGLRAVP
jgi:hypothetical protein